MGSLCKTRKLLLGLDIFLHL